MCLNGLISHVCFPRESVSALCVRLCYVCSLSFGFRPRTLYLIHSYVENFALCLICVKINIYLNFLHPCCLAGLVPH